MPAFKRGYQIAAARSRGSFNAASANDALERFMRFARFERIRTILGGRYSKNSMLVSGFINFNEAKRAMITASGQPHEQRWTVGPPSDPGAASYRATVRESDARPARRYPSRGLRPIGRLLRWAALMSSGRTKPIWPASAALTSPTTSATRGCTAASTASADAFRTVTDDRRRK